MKKYVVITNHEGYITGIDLFDDDIEAICASDFHDDDEESNTMLELEIDDGFLTEESINQINEFLKDFFDTYCKGE